METLVILDAIALFIMFSIRIWVVPMFPLWSSMAMSIVAYSITYSPTILVGLCVKSVLSCLRRVYTFNDLVIYCCRKKKIYLLK